MQSIAKSALANAASRFVAEAAKHQEAGRSGGRSPVRGSYGTDAGPAMALARGVLERYAAMGAE